VRPGLLCSELPLKWEDRESCRSWSLEALSEFEIGGSREKMMVSKNSLVNKLETDELRGLQVKAAPYLKWWHSSRGGQNCIHTPYSTVHMVNCLLNYVYGFGQPKT